MLHILQKTELIYQLLKTTWQKKTLFPKIENYSTAKFYYLKLCWWFSRGS